MNIAIDSSALHYERQRGIGNYIYSQIEALLNNHQEHNYYIFDIFCDAEIDSMFIEYENINIIHFNLGDDGQFAIGNHKEILKRLLKRFLEDYDIDVFYITNPIARGYKCFYEEDFFTENVLVVSMLFDLIPIIFKDHYLPNKELFEMYDQCLKQYEFSDYVLSDSQSAKNDLLKYTNVDESKVIVIDAGVDKKFLEIKAEQLLFENLKKKHNLTKDYIMCTSGNEWRKNIGGLIESYCMLPNDYKNNHQLLIVCNIDQGSIDEYLNNVNKDDKNNIIFTGYVSDEEIVALYNNAKLFVFPSKYEGFGLPIIEAWSFGVPVVTSNVSSMKDFDNSATILVNPEDPKSICDGMIEGLDENKREELIKNGYNAVTAFTWDKVAEKTIKTFENKKNIIVSKEQHTKDKIAMFAPMPPEKSGIADYSYDIITYLCEFYDIDVFVTGSYESDKIDASNVRILNHNEFNEDNYKKVIYQFGNNVVFHEYMIPYIRESKKSILVLHDINLNGLLTWMCRTNNDRAFLITSYKEEFKYLNPRKFIELDETGRANNLIDEHPINAFVTKYSKQIITHSEYGKRKLLKTNINQNVDVIRHYVKIGELPNRDEAKTKLDLKDKLVISCFGYAQNSKRILQIVKALSNIKSDYMFCIIGKVEDDIKEELESLIETNKLEDKIRITGFASLEDFLLYIDATDICINLRHPYNGETSGSFMRILAKGRCAIVNDIGSFSEIPNNACFKIPPVEIMNEKEEIAKIENSLKFLIENEAVRESIERNARTYAENELDINVVIKDYCKTIEKPIEESLINNGLISEIKNYAASNNKGRGFLSSITKTLAYVQGEKYEKQEKGFNIERLLEAIES